MNRNLENAICGVLDYAAYPTGMLLAAPVLLRTLGPAEFGVYAFALAAANAGAILASGFGDANLQQVALARSTGDAKRVENCIRTTLGIHLLLGLVLAGATCIAAPSLSRRIAAGASDPHACAVCLRIAGVLMLFRAVETVVVSTHRAFERYSEAVRISGSVRVLSLGASAALAAAGWNTQQILAAAAVAMALGTTAQCVLLCRFVPARCLLPQLQLGTSKSLIKLGALTSAQAGAALLFSQVDRLLVGVVFGAVIVGAYTLCTQIAQPIAGTAASALHFIFPHLAHTAGSQGGLQAVRVTVAKAFVFNLVVVGIEAVLLLCFGRVFLRVWAAPIALQVPTWLLPLAVLASALVGLNVTGNYAMLALGRAGTVVSTTLASGAAMLCSIVWLSRHFGVTGVAVSRVLFGFVSLGIYIGLDRLLSKHGSSVRCSPSLHVSDVEEVS